MSTVRPVLVVDGDGQLVGSFPGWESAHEWAHLRARQAASQAAPPLPIRVEDLRARRTLEVYPDRCELTTWRAARRQPDERSGESCGVPAPEAARDP